MNKKNGLTAALILNLIIFALEIIGLVMSVREQQWGTFRFYTQDSNALAMLACGIMAAYQIACLCGRREREAAWAVVFKYVSVCLLCVTFLVVLFVLAPMYGGIAGYPMLLFSGTMLYHHFLCPVLAFISFVFFDKGFRITKADVRIALLPTLLYAVVMTVLNILRVVTGPYPFLMVYNQPVYMSVVWFIVILGGAYAIAALTRLLKNKAERRGA